MTVENEPVTALDPRKETVARGYDQISDSYVEWSGRTTDPGRERLTVEFARMLPTGAEVLDLGCGAGIPTTAELAARFEVTGVDASERQIEAARQNVPRASFIHADFATIDFPEAAFDGVVALYSITHVPREEHGDLLRRIASWLRPGGVLLATLGTRDSPDWTGEWLGGRMFFSSYDAATNRAMVREAGFEPIVDEVIDTLEPEGPTPFLWVLARKSAR